MKPVYLDNAATTAMDAEVERLMQKCQLQIYGNASSIHKKGREAKEKLEEARGVIAKSIGAEEKEIIFTSGGTEANNFAVKGVAFANKEKGKHIITTKIEHECVLNSCGWLEGQGWKVTYLGVDGEGFVSGKKLEKAIRKDTVLVSIIHGNNEIGTIQDLRELHEICMRHDVIFHTDACQSYMKTELKADWADLITLNAHKLHGPKGVGALYIKEGVKISTWQHGGGHERGMRSGTENLAGIAGFAKAVEIAMEDDAGRGRMEELRDCLIAMLLKIPRTTLNGPMGERRLCNNVNVSFAGVEGEGIVAVLDAKGVCASTGSACASRSLEPSHVLMALENNPERAHGSVRFTLSRYNTEEEVEYAAECAREAVQRLRKISPLEGKRGRCDYVRR